MSGVVIASISSGSVALLLSALLIIASKFFYTKTDEKVEQIIDVLPGANCGACKKAGCAQLASAIVAGDLPVNACPVGGAVVAEAVAEIMGVVAPLAQERKRAFIFCHGYEDIALSNKAYLGIHKCSGAHLLGGNKDCSYGCLGFGDCLKACPFNAIEESETGIPVIIENKCTACGACVKACPRNLIELHLASQEFHVYCKSQDKGAVAKKQCAKACIACGICTKNTDGTIGINKFLAVVDYGNYHLDESNRVKCPTGALTDENINVVKSSYLS